MIRVKDDDRLESGGGDRIEQTVSDPVGNGDRRSRMESDASQVPNNSANTGWQSFLTLRVQSTAINELTQASARSS